MISAPVLPIPKSGRNAEFIVATDASKFGIAGVLLQEDYEGHMQTETMCLMGSEIERC